MCLMMLGLFGSQVTLQVCMLMETIPSCAAVAVLLRYENENCQPEQSSCSLNDCAFEKLFHEIQVRSLDWTLFTLLALRLVNIVIILLLRIRENNIIICMIDEYKIF